VSKVQSGFIFIVAGWMFASLVLVRFGLFRVVAGLATRSGSLGGK